MRSPDNAAFGYLLAGGRSCSARPPAGRRRGRRRRGASSRSIVRNRSSRSGSDASRTCTSSCARSRWPRNSCPRPAPSARALDQPRHVRHRRAVTGPARHHAEVGLERRERIVRDLRPRRDRARSVDLPAFGKPEEPHVGERASAAARARSRRPAARSPRSEASGASASRSGALPRPPRPPARRRRAAGGPGRRGAHRRRRTAACRREREAGVLAVGTVLLGPAAVAAVDRLDVPSRT